MPHYYAICQEEDRELTECKLIEHFVDIEDMLCDGPYAGPWAYGQISVGFFVKSEDTFNWIALQLFPEAIWFLDSDGFVLDGRELGDS